ncbi:uncharacterized protein GLRG_11979 [Colletotrichum graminicola M1.001]|uniref:Uncharacterized protein n=1 Tax=Colletotrichum graminicola (strain M1.001 / M2 / FGSC 10212) TaxID=645133 RepID=E3R145_COLGM|nr:uncharacterized protein GLRG_11979 [Colletotrichum graminicola M1.001]EFQ36833.1 hypothetical protein GLRG_11979 [Colletotrichum graminicola M1.001]
MVLITFKHLVLLISLFNVALASKVLIGYRRVSRREASEINRRSNIFRDPRYDTKANKEGGAQIGNGVYLSMKVNGYAAGRRDW